MRKFSGNKYHFNSEYPTNGPNYRKPVMKGGHTHNHVFNAVNRHTFRKKKQRLKAKNRKFLFDRSPKETLEDSLNHWAIFKEFFYNKV